MTSNQYVSLTRDQKLQALAHRFYQDAKWMVTAGDYYTSSRADLELYRVVKIEGDKVFTEYCTRPGQLAEWDLWTFTTEGFGLKRVHVPDWILSKVKIRPDLQSLCDRLDDVWNTDDTPDELSQEAKAAIETLWESLEDE